MTMPVFYGRGEPPEEDRCYGIDNPFILYALKSDFDISLLSMPLRRLIVCVLLSCAWVCGGGKAAGECLECEECSPRIAVKTNLLQDALLTPDVGVELCLGRRWSVGAEGVWAWWSRNARHRFWRVYGGWAEFRYWPGKRPLRRAMTGHHVGMYCSALSYDFEFGGKGWQSPGLTWGVGVSYGYSLPIGDRLNLDLSVRAGYSTGKLIKYRPQCGTYVCVSRSTQRYLGLTGLEVTLVWFPGRASKNNPVYGL